MDGGGKSDGPAVPEKPPNNAGRPAAEAVEGRGPAKGNPHERNALRTPSRAGAPSALERDAAAGVDGETWQHYGEDLEANLRVKKLRVMARTHSGPRVGMTHGPSLDLVGIGSRSLIVLDGLLLHSDRSADGLAPSNGSAAVTPTQAPRSQAVRCAHLVRGIDRALGEPELWPSDVCEQSVRFAVAHSASTMACPGSAPPLPTA